MSGPAPFGTRWIHGKLVPEPAETGVVAALVEAFVSAGARLKATAVSLNGKGYVTRRGGSWTDVAVARVMRQKGLQDLVPEALWRRCEGLLAAREDSERAPGRRSAHPLGGVVLCQCGGKMYLRGGGPSGKFICQDCRSKIPYETLDRKFVESLSKVVVRPQEVVAEIRDDPRAAEVARAVGNRDVAIAEVWPSLAAGERRQLVDVLVARVVVHQDAIEVLLAISEDFQAESEAPQLNSSPRSHDLRSPRDKATKQLASVPEQQAGDGRGDRPAQIPAVAPKAYRIQQVAELLSLPRSTVYDMVRTGALTSIRVGSGNGRGVVLVPASAVAAFLEEKRRRR